MAHSKFFIFWWTLFKCRQRLEWRPNFFVQMLHLKFFMVLHSEAFSLTKLKPHASFLADDGAKGNASQNVAMPSPPGSPPPIQLRTPGKQRIINT
jgi:hypothetical protein